MKVTWTPDGGSAITLAGEAGGNDCSDHTNGFGHSETGAVQTDALVDGAAPFRAHRGNTLATIRFSMTSAEYENHPAAVAANATLAAALRGTLGTARVINPLTAATVLTLTDASIDFDFGAFGVRAERRFTITGIPS